MFTRRKKLSGVIISRKNHIAAFLVLYFSVCNCNVLNIAFSSVLFVECISDKPYYQGTNLLRSKYKLDTG